MPEYVVMFFIVVAGLVAMIVFVQRGLQARIRDARVYMIETASEACLAAGASGDVNCAGAANLQDNSILQEYEPYYAMTQSLVGRSGGTDKGFAGATYFKQTDEVTAVSSNSVQQPPRSAN